MGSEDEWENIMRIGRIHIPDNATDTSQFCLPVQANGADAFKLALCLFSSGLQEVDARIVHTFHDETIVEARDDRGSGGGDCKGWDGGSIGADYPRGPFVAEIRMAEAWG